MKKIDYSLKFMKSSLFCALSIAASCIVESAIAKVPDFENYKPDDWIIKSLPRIEIAGKPVLYLSSEKMKCPSIDKRIGSGIDVTDVPINAFRREDGSVVIISGNQNNYYIEGKSINQATRVSCSSLIEIANKEDPKKFQGRRWLFDTHKAKTGLILGFVHNEYHGDDFDIKNCKRSSQSNYECWYGSSTLVTSSDGGFSFTDPPSPYNVVATLQDKYRAGAKRAGLTSPKVIENPKDGYVYVMVDRVDRNRRMRASQCLLRGRGDKLDVWKGWNGEGFTLNLGSPYIKKQRPNDCKPVLDFIVQSVKYVKNLKIFLAIGYKDDNIIYSFSKNLISWTNPATLIGKQKSPNNFIVKTWPTYFSVLDSASVDDNFDVIENSPYLYFVHTRTDRRKRDVYRVPLRIRGGD